MQVTLDCIPSLKDLYSAQEGKLEVTDLDQGRLANLVRYHCVHPPEGGQVRAATKQLKRVAFSQLDPLMLRKRAKLGPPEGTEASSPTGEDPGGH